ncbi:Uncharacterised protein [Mycobacteroides abscessus subsp. abscessus]|nr:Uncharacterised protein [Mycobacteroides abscessus subsp. abscessus]
MAAGAVSLIVICAPLFMVLFRPSPGQCQSPLKRC